MELKFVPIPVPTELIEESGIDLTDVLEFTVVNGKLTIKNADADGFNCDGDCESCPFSEQDCEGDCDESED